MSERVIIYLGDTVADCYACKHIARIKRKAAYLTHTIGNYKTDE